MKVPSIPWSTRERGGGDLVIVAMEMARMDVFSRAMIGPETDPMSQHSQSSTDRARSRAARRVASASQNARAIDQLEEHGLRTFTSTKAGRDVKSTKVLRTFEAGENKGAVMAQSVFLYLRVWSSTIYDESVLSDMRIRIMRARILLSKGC